MKNNISRYLDRYPTRRLKDTANIIMPVMNLDRRMFDIWSEVVQRLFMHTKWPYHLTFVINSDHELTINKAKELEKFNTNITAIINETNAGFAKSCNQGFDAKYRYNVVFNSDVFVYEDGWLKSMVEVAAALPDTGIVAPLVQPGGIDSALHTAEKQDGKVFTHYQKCPAVLWLVKRQCWLDVGGFDEDFWPGLYEDDLFQAKAKFKGWQISRDGRVWVNHLTNFTSKKAFTPEGMQAFREKNFKLYQRKLSALKAQGYVDDPVWIGEVAAIRPYFIGKGIDICCGPRKVRKDCIGFDRKGKVADVKGDASRLPFKDQSLEWTSAVHAIEHFEDTSATLKEWARVIKPGGHLCLIVPNKDRNQINKPTDHKHEFLPMEFRRIVEQSGIGKIVQFNTLFNKWSFDCVVEVK